MTQKDKELLLKDLCARLPYGVKIALKNSQGYHHENIAKKDDVTIDKLKGFNDGYFSIYHDNPLDWDWFICDIDIEDIKPYLFPLSSMSEEQKKEFDQCVELELKAINDEIDPTYATAFEVDFYNKYHFDWRGLIPLGLAKDASELNLY